MKSNLIKFRSKYEREIWRNAQSRGLDLQHESKDSALVYVSNSVYMPDFRLPNGILIESKGYFKPQDRRKMLEVKESHPDKDIRFLFQNPNNTLTKGKNSKTYAKWAEYHGFKWAGGTKIPCEWWEEKKNE